MSNKLYRELNSASIERQVEDAYNEAFKKGFPGISISYPFSCDGYFELKLDDKNIRRVLIEYKFDFKLNSPVERAKVLAQTLFYLKKFEEAGMSPPDVIFVENKNECFTLHANALHKYLDFAGIDWSKAPSNASMNGDLVLALAEDTGINPFVFDVNEDFDFSVVCEKIKSMALGETRLVHVSEHNIDRVFNAFEKNVVKEKISPNDIVALFFAFVTGSQDLYLHPSKGNCAVWNGRNIRVDARIWKAFKSHFASTCTPREKARLAAISDRLIEDRNRRRKGEFYTPTEFVDYSHRMISEKLGDDWKDQYVVWDCACGTKNLTRDYRFKELYCSTLENAELDISKNYNPEATAFQFDFLNDELKRISEGGKAPDGLIDALEADKPIMFYLNPPYKTVSYTNGGSDGISKNSLINTEMAINDFGRSRQEVYAQFLYRIYDIKKKFKLNNCIIALFCKPKFLCGNTFDKFRKYFLKEFQFENGIFFNAGYFGNVSTTWGITFNIWSSGETLNKNMFMHSIVECTNAGISVVDQKNLYNIDDNPRYLREMISFQKRNAEAIAIKYPNPLTFDSTSKIKTTPDGIGSIFFGTTSYGGSTLLYYHGHDIIITKDNIKDVAVIYSTVNNKKTNWINEKDEFSQPDKSHVYYQSYATDCLIYLLFGIYDFSFRQIDYKNKKHDVKNEFFWMPKSEIEDLANENGLDGLYNDAHTSDERFMYKKLKETSLSPEAKAVLDKASELVRKSFKYRKLFDAERPEYQLTKAWDAGWYQVKAILKEYMPDELKEFRALYKALGDKMRPLVYELGFLRK